MRQRIAGKNGDPAPRTAVVVVMVHPIIAHQAKDAAIFVRRPAHS